MNQILIGVNNMPKPVKNVYIADCIGKPRKVTAIYLGIDNKPVKIFNLNDSSN